MGGLTILNRPLYSVTEAARLLRIPSGTLRRWLEGWEVRGTLYEPVIRTAPTGADAVTWAEFIEAGFLREYRLAKRVSLQRMRPFLERARSELNVPYPLAHFKPFVSNRELVYELQVESSLDPATSTSARAPVSVRHSWTTASGCSVSRTLGTRPAGGCSNSSCDVGRGLSRRPQAKQGRTSSP